MNRAIPFNFDMPLSVFEKADAPEGRQRRIGGIASLETKDKQNEEILARGLDFSEFLVDGWFNDNHSKKTDDILGYPESTKLFRKGETLPDGQSALANGHWVEGYLLEGHPPSDRIWELGKALAKTNRRLGFSVEGKILKRAGMNKSGANVIAKAKVRNVAITNCPVNSGARMEILAKSLQAVENSTEDTDEDLLQKIYTKVDDVSKALAMGAATGINPPAGVQTGEGAGQVLTGQSLEQKDKPPRVVESKKKKDEDEEKTKKALTDSEAFAWVKNRIPKATEKQIRRFVKLTKRLKRQNRL